MKEYKRTRKFRYSLILILCLFCSGLTACDLTAELAGTGLGSIFGAKGNDMLPCPELKIGVLLDEDDAVVGQSQKRGYEQAVREINDAGGVGGCPVDLVYHDEGEPGDPEAARIAVRQLANEGVLAVIGATHSDATLNAAAIVDYFEVPLIIPSASNDELLQDGNLWRFRVSPSNRSNAELAFEMLSKITDSTISMAVLYEESNYGEDSAIAAANQALLHQFEVLYYQDYSIVNPDFSLLMKEIDQIDPNILYIITSDPGDAERIVDEAGRSLSGVNLIVGHGMGFCAQNFVDDSNSAFWNLSEMLAYSCSWADNAMLNDGTMIVQPPLVEASMSLRLTAEAMEKAFETDSLWRLNLTDSSKLPVVRNAVAQSLRMNSFDLDGVGFESVKFDGQGQNRVTPVMLQIIDRTLKTVYPPDKAVESPVFIPGW